MTREGGTFAVGTIFKMTTSGTPTTLHSFDCRAEGCHSPGGLIQASDGNFYGTTSDFDPTGGGTVFKLTAAGTLTTLHSFGCSTQRCVPRARLIRGPPPEKLFSPG